MTLINLRKNFGCFNSTFALKWRLSAILVSSHLGVKLWFFVCCFVFFYFVDILHNDKCRYRKQADSDKCKSEILYHHKSLKSLMYLLMRKVETTTDTNKATRAKQLIIINQFSNSLICVTKNADIAKNDATATLSQYFHIPICPFFSSFILINGIIIQKVCKVKFNFLPLFTKFKQAKSTLNSRFLPCCFVF